MKLPLEPMPPVMPACWDNQQAWAEWNRFNLLSRANSNEPLDNFCADCEPAFKQAMHEADRCGYPQVHFVRIIERQYDPATGKRHVVTTAAIKGVR